MNCVATTDKRSDGFGAQFQNIIFDILFTSAMTPHVQYVFPSNIEPMQFEHNYNQDPDFAARMIRFMNLDAVFCVAPPIGPPIRVNRYKGTETYAFCEANLTRLLETDIFKLIKRMFFENKVSPYDNNNNNNNSNSNNSNNAFYNVAVHVRNHSPQDMRIHKRTNESAQYYIRVMRHIISSYKGIKPIRFHIHSQRNVDPAFAQYANAGSTFQCVMHLDESVEDAFSGLVFADALITSASSFSYVAAMLTDGVVYYKQFWHKPSMNWIIGDNLR